MSTFDLAFKGNTVALRAVLSIQPAKVNEISPDRGTSLLYSAARWGHLTMVQMLVEEFHADVNITNRENKSTPLHGAAFGGHADIVRYLLSKGASQLKNAYDETPMQNAKAPAEGVTKAAAKQTIAAFSTPIGTPATPAVAPGSVPPSAAPPFADTVVTVLLSTPAAPPAAPAPISSLTTPASLDGLTIAQLRSILMAKGLPTTGTKADLIKRIQAGIVDGTSTMATTAAAASGSSSAPASSPNKKKTDRDETLDEPSTAPPTKVLVVECPAASAAPAAPSPPVAATSDPSTSTPTPASASAFDPAWVEKLRNATYTQTEVVPNTQEFWDLEEKVNAWNQGRNEDYVSNRLKKKKKPLTFVLKRAWKICNPVLEEAFNEKRKEFTSSLEENQCRVRVAFHGTRDENIPSILRTGLLRFKHPLNPCKTQADDGYFGTNLKGVYVSRYYDYTLKYCNGLNPLDDGDSAKTIMFKCLPGKVFNIAKLSMGIDPTPGYCSHSSPNNLEWYLFDERQLCPEYIIEMKAQVDTRTAADDE